ncbi:MAG TPA: methylmalonyl-CoA mutase family protein [Bacteroidales bacterium]|nr:methylmalonyl-CoA mutase family protein [Bacteroidales bacterium]
MEENSRPEAWKDRFPPVSTEAWEQKIREDLKGADYDRKMIWNTPEGLRLKPFYRGEDLKSLGHLGHYPGEFPYIRGKSAYGNSWRIRQDIRVKDIGEANSKALDILMKGIDSLGFILDEQHDYTRDEIDALLKNIHAHAVELNFICGEQAPNLVRIIDQLVKDYNRDLEQIHGAVDYDPLGRILMKGRFSSDEETAFERARDLMEKAAHLPHFRVMAVHGSHLHNAGANTVQELAFALAAGNEYLARITQLGVSVTQVAPRIRFNFATGSSYFMEIAKYRAARMLWARIVLEYGGDAPAARMNIRALTSSWNKTLYDPYVNMLRTTTEAMAAIIGGMDSLTVGAYDGTAGDPSEFGERIARNQQLLLKEESYLDKVADPAAGSYYIENLTDSLAREAWKLFQEVEAEGGFLQAVRNGSIQRAIASSASARDMALATRKSILVGTNQYPNFNESLDALEDESVLWPSVAALPDAEVEVLKPYRGAQALERLRYATDRHVAGGGQRPGVFLFTYGNLAMRKARAMFSANFFACAGFSIQDHPGFGTVEEGIAAARASKAPFVVICSSDEEYADIALPIFEALKEEATIILAGYPQELLDTLKAGGLQEFIHVRSNLLQTLQHYQAIAGIRQ